MNAALIPIPIDDPLPMAWLDTNDLGNAERLVRLAKGLLLWVDELGWLGFDTRRWSVRDGPRMANRLAHDVARHVDREAAELAKIADDPGALERVFGYAIPPDRAKERVLALRKWAVKSGDASRTSAMLTQARDLMPARLEDFDKDPLAFNCLNGTLRFLKRQGGGWVAKLRPHDPRDMIRQLANVEYDDAAKCPQWRERMELVQPSADQRDFLQQRYGYCLTGLTSEQKWFIDQGRGGDGKSLTNAVITALMGDYYRHAAIETFLEGAQKSGSDHSSDLARLQGDIRMVLVDEPKAQSTWNSGRLKQVTGSTITARPMRKEEIEYVARWKLIAEINPFPKVSNDDDGFWRRVHITPWSYQFDKDGTVAAEPFEALLERYAAEGAGILNWMVDGALKWLESRRLPISQAAQVAISNYRQSASAIGAWLLERADRGDKSAETAASVLYADFKQFCEEIGVEKAPSQTAFGNKLSAEQCYVKKDGKGNRVRLGIKLKPSGMGALDGAGAARQPAAGPAVSSESGVGGRAWPEDDFEDDRP